MRELLGYVHHIRGTTITIKTMHKVKAAGKERVEYSHVALPVKRNADKDPDRDLVDTAVDMLGDYVVIKVEGGFISSLRKATADEAKKMKESFEEPKPIVKTTSQQTAKA